MKCSIVIPAFNEEKLIGAALGSVHRAMASVPGADGEYEIVVCDNNSTDRTAEIAREHGARVVFEPVNQIAKARNAGGNAAEAEWLVFLDADSEVSAELMAAVWARMDDPRIMGGGALVHTDSKDYSFRLATGFWNWLSRTMTWTAGSFIYCRRTAFLKIGGFNTDLFVAEDVDFSRRLKPIARRDELRLNIICEARVTTSSRKVGLYGRFELIRTCLFAVFLPRRMMRNRDHCHVWYDGRR